MHVHTDAPFIVPFNEAPSITPQIDEGERRNRAKKKGESGAGRWVCAEKTDRIPQEPH
jgi:hypothetical protein